ncbi:hypothetical protein Taro_003326 [Colocasia esculenta]|uniref:Uncharacterized protein n=1 Tax=Colocasia esculenta TaxID=4460 RepID=A0A843TRH5_COLES|nr:hypothetical protein [Colocasia esculenta]
MNYIQEWVLGASSAFPEGGLKRFLGLFVCGQPPPSVLANLESHLVERRVVLFQVFLKFWPGLLHSNSPSFSLEEDTHKRDLLSANDRKVQLRGPKHDSEVLDLLLQLGLPVAVVFFTLFTERLCRVLNASVVRGAFWLPPLGLTSACAPCVAHGVELADVGQTELSQALLDQGRSCCGRFGVPAWCSMRSQCEDVARSRGNAAPCMDCTFFVKRVAEFGGPAPILECLFIWEPQVLCEPGTCVYSGLVPVQWYRRGLVVFLDTLTLGESFGPYVRDCEAERWFPTEPVLVEAHSLIVLFRVYRWCRLRRCCDRLVPPVVVLVQFCELVLSRGEELLWVIRRSGVVFNALSTVVGMEDPEMVPRLGFLPEKATVSTVATRSRQADPSHQGLLSDISWRRDQKAVMASVAITTEGSALQAVGCVAEFGGPAPIPECLFSWEPQVLCEPGICVCSGLVPVQWYRRGLVVFLDTLTLGESCRPLDLTSVTARLRGSSFVVLSGLDIGVMNQ